MVHVGCTVLLASKVWPLACCLCNRSNGAVETLKRTQRLRGRKSPHGGAQRLLDDSPWGRRAHQFTPGCSRTGPHHCVSHPKLPPFVKGWCREKASASAVLFVCILNILICLVNPALLPREAPCSSLLILPAGTCWGNGGCTKDPIPRPSEERNVLQTSGATSRGPSGSLGESRKSCLVG